MTKYPEISHDDDGATLITLRLPQELNESWSWYDLWSFADALETVIIAVSRARLDSTGEATVSKGEWGHMLSTLQRVYLRMEAIRAHAITAHHAAGGSITDLQHAIESPRTTAADARRRAADADRYPYSGWVRGEHQQHDQAPDQTRPDAVSRQAMATELREALRDGTSTELRAAADRVRDAGIDPAELLTMIPARPLGPDTDDE